MRIFIKRHSVDTDMIEMYCRYGKTGKMLMCVVHQDTLADIPHIDEYGDDHINDGMMIELVSSAGTKEEHGFWDF